MTDRLQPDSLPAELKAVRAERDCLAKAVMFARQWNTDAPMGLREGLGEILATMPSSDEDRQEAASPTPITAHWDRTVIHPEADPDDDTIVCCLTDDGRPVALFLDDEHREALGLLLVDPEGE